MTEDHSKRYPLKKLVDGFRTGPLSRLWPYLTIAVVTIAVSIWMQWDTADMFPNGDSYIHLSYARTLAETGELNYNPGVREGVGSTSVLWVFVLAVFHRLTEHPILWTRMLGIGLLALDACLIYDFARFLFERFAPHLRRAHAVAIALLATISGSLVWMAQSGMETIFWVTLVLLALRAYQASRWVLLGVFLGLFALTRIEGVLLAAAILLIDLLHNRCITKNMFKIAIPVIVLVLPWLIYLQLREGSPTTSSYIARNFYMHGINERLISEFPALEWTIKIPPIFYTLQWFGFLSFFATGLVSLAGPLATVKVTEIGATIELSLIGMILGAAITIFVCVITIRALWKRRRLFSLSRVEGRLLLISGGWLAAHNLVFAILMPRIGGAGRYVPFNNMLYWVLLGVGAYVLLKGRARFVGITLMVALTALSLVYWKQLYRANVVNMTAVRQAGAQYIDEQLPPDEAVGGIDIGIQRYYARQLYVDLAGHVNNDVLTYWEADGSVAGFVVEKQLCHIALQGPVDGTGLDMRQAMGLEGDERFELVQEAFFSTPLEEWQRGIGPILYMPAAIVYRVEWHDQDFCDDL